ncbi:ras-related Rab-38-like [Paramuricea clavata]|uniref:Ras-related Rab-38-like n=1 Tax=Paramuricea clavata TaxID=317549 RepID=A0A7D9JAI1_PARCT|nr:ras-related Rab-38-like [Paramuricea clavata]
MAEACIGTANKNTKDQGKSEEMIDMNTSTLSVEVENTTSDEPEVAIENSCDGKTFFKVLCVGDFSGAWSKGVYIEDYVSNDETICQHPYNRPIIGVDFRVKCLYDKRGKKIRIEIWNLAEHERFFPTNKLQYGNSDGAIVFWGPKSHTMECALKYKHEITQIKPDIPFVLLVDNVFQTPEKWMGEGLIMNSPDEMDSFCLEHGFFAWFEMLERTGGEKSVFGQAVSTLINEIISRNNTVATSENQQRSCIIV